MNGLNLSEASDIRLWGSAINAIYYGSTLLWPLSPRDYSKEYLTIEATSNSAYFDFKIDEELAYPRILTIQWSKDKINWKSKTSRWDDNKIYLSKGEKIFLKGTNSYYGRQQEKDGLLLSGSNYLDIKDAKVYGNIMSMIYGDNFYGQTVLPSDFTFRKFFWNSANIDASNLILPSTELTYACYAQMFNGCSCISAPKLPATTLAPWCYYAMFDTSKITITPELPALTLADHCYYGMFINCMCLEQALELPATTLAALCYANMFSGCYNLLTAPLELPATTLAASCYANMFSGCNILTTAPVLPATTLVNNCYDQMFIKCYDLNYIKCLATDVSASNCLYRWTENVASTGTFVKNPNMTNWYTGTHGIPSGWTVQDAS